MTNAHTECNAEDCHRSAHNGAILYRVASKGQRLGRGCAPSTPPRNAPRGVVGIRPLSGGSDG